MLALVVSILAFCIAVLAAMRAWADHYLYRKRIVRLHQRTLATEKKLQQLGDLSNEIAHEIKNPITAILCSAETLDLLIGDQIDPLHRQSLRYIKEYGDNLLRLVSDFLDVSRAKAGKLESYPEVVKVAPVAESIIGLLGSFAEAKQIDIKLLSAEENLAAYVDPNHLKQILFNLIHNAIKFTEQGGEIRINLKADFPNPFLKIAVEDNGVGISEEKLERLFKPYWQEGNEFQASRGGSGLGLSLCKMLVEMAGGVLEVHSKPGVGSSFEFTVPLHQLLGQEQRSPKSEEIRLAEIHGDRHPLRGQRFLVVDQDLGAREAIARLIEAWGGMVDRVTLAVEAVEALAAHNYDAIMIDDSLDGLYGYELARMVRDELKQDQTTIILATRHEIDEELLRDSGADKCIEKPLNGDTLLDSLIKTGKYSVTH